MSTTLTTSKTAEPSDRLKINGELVILVDGRLSFDALQQRLVTSPPRPARRPPSCPRRLPRSICSPPVGSTCARSAGRCGGDGSSRWRDWVPPLQLTPVTADLGEATEWFEVLPAALGVEGLVVKGAATRYTPGRRDTWVKVNSLGWVAHGHVAGGPCAWSGGWCRVGCRARQVSRTCGGGVLVDLPVGLAGPVEFELAQAVKALPGGSRYEPKWDGGP
jgi:hypothetical protein